MVGPLPVEVRPNDALGTHGDACLVTWRLGPGWPTGNYSVLESRCGTAAPARRLNGRGGKTGKAIC